MISCNREIPGRTLQQRIQSQLYFYARILYLTYTISQTLSDLYLITQTGSVSLVFSRHRIFDVQCKEG